MKAKELREKSIEELVKLLAESRREKLQLRLQAATKQLQTVHLMRSKRREIARIQTILTQKAQEVVA